MNAGQQWSRGAGRRSRGEAGGSGGPPPDGAAALSGARTRGLFKLRDRATARAGLLDPPAHVGTDLVAGITVLLLALGLIMVLSTSSAQTWTTAARRTPAFRSSWSA